MKKWLKLFAFTVLIAIVIYIIYNFTKNDFSLEDFIIKIWNEHVETWGYLILFCWSILEGELGLILAGVAAHDGKMDVILAIFVAGLGGFVGDQIYFYIGRYNKKYIQKKLRSQRRKFAVAHLLLQRFGWPIIFIQRYMYGFRTIIPMSIGITRYSSKKFAIINLLSAWIWATITILLAWYFGSLIQTFLHWSKEWIKEYWYLAAIIVIAFLSGIIFIFKRIEKAILKERRKK
ncbi:DedA family protein [Campylobacter sp. W0018]|uniref:DedA family protein n=1 Tax=Campylobacter sp. W0018 TaxID=2735782 RepID=UPI00301D2C81|nr:DedA family protein [Campylobacter sp. W0018]